MPRKVIKVLDEKIVALVTVSAPDRKATEELAKEVYRALRGKYNATMWAEEV